MSTIKEQFKNPSFKRWRDIVDQNVAHNADEKTRLAQLTDTELRGLYQKWLASDAINPLTGEIPQTVDQVLWDNAGVIVSDYLSAHSKELKQRATPEGQAAAATQGAQTRVAQALQGGTKPLASDVKNAFSNSNLDPDFRQGLFSTLSQSGVNVDYSVLGSQFDLTTPIYGISGTRTQINRVFSNRDIAAGGPRTVDVATYATQPAGEWLRGLYQMDPSEVVDLQHQLWEKGWYPSDISSFDEIASGLIDSATLAAYQSALQRTAQVNLGTDNTVSLDAIIQRGDPDAKAKTKARYKTGGISAVTNPIETKAAYRSQYGALTGLAPTPEQAASFSASYRAQEEVANAQAARGAGTVTAPPSVGSAAEEYVREHQPTDVLGYGLLSRMNDFYSMLRSPTGT